MVRALGRDEAGSSLVEMGLAAPLLAALLMGMTDLGLGFSAKLQLEQAAQRTIERVMQQTSVASDYNTALKIEGADAAGVPLTNVTPESWLECSADGSNWRIAGGLTAECTATETYYARYVTVEIVKTYDPLFSTYGAGNADGTFTLRGKAGVRIQ